MSQLLNITNIPKESLYDTLMALITGFIHGTSLYGYNVTKGGINKDVINSITEILAITPENENTNVWNCLTKLLEFISCMVDSKLFDYTGVKIENYVSFLNDQIVQIVFLDDIIRNKTRRKFSTLYPNRNIADDKDKDNNNFYKNFALNDFFNANNKQFILPPSVLLFLSIKLNPIINNPSFWLNKTLRGYVEYASNKQCYYKEDDAVMEELEKFIAEEDPSNEINLTSQDSNLIDVAIIGLTNGTDSDIIDNNNDISSSNSIITVASKKYNEMLTEVTVKIKGGMNIFNVFKLNVFKPRDPILRQKEVLDKMKSLDEKTLALETEYKNANTNKRFFGLMSDDKTILENKLKKNKSKLTELKIEYDNLNDMVTNVNHTKQIKLNYILSKIILMSGIGIGHISRDLCTNSDKSNVSWNTFDKLLKILDGRIFNTIALSSSNIIKHSIIQFIVPYSIFLHININKFLYNKLKFTEKEIKEFELWYSIYENQVFNDYLHDDGNYYEEIVENKNDKNMMDTIYKNAYILKSIISNKSDDNKIEEVKNIYKNKYALFPSAKLLNNIKDDINSGKYNNVT